MQNLREVDCCAKCKHFVDIEAYPTLCGRETNPYKWEDPYEWAAIQWQSWEIERTMKEIELDVKPFHVCDLFEPKI